jgi:hypothetical protein
MILNRIKQNKIKIIIEHIESLDDSEGFYDFSIASEEDKKLYIATFTTDPDVIEGVCRYFEEGDEMNDPGIQQAEEESSEAEIDYYEDLAYPDSEG